MIYLIGGPPRVGKSSLAKKITLEKGISSVSTDVLNNMLHDAAPQLGIRDGNHREIANNFAPFLTQFIRYTNYQLPFYTVEGDTIYPHIIAQIQKDHEVKACCLGNQSTTRELLLAHAGDNDWISRQSPAEQEKLANWVAELSREMEKECKGFGIAYFDLSGDFGENIREAYEYLTG